MTTYLSTFDGIYAKGRLPGHGEGQHTHVQVFFRVGALVRQGADTTAILQAAEQWREPGYTEAQTQAEAETFLETTVTKAAAARRNLPWSGKDTAELEHTETLEHHLHISSFNLVLPFVDPRI